MKLCLVVKVWIMFLSEVYTESFIPEDLESISQKEKLKLEPREFIKCLLGFSGMSWLKKKTHIFLNMTYKLEFPSNIK